MVTDLGLLSWSHTVREDQVEEIKMAGAYSSNGRAEKFMKTSDRHCDGDRLSERSEDK